jgi:hypothetical protein
LTPNQFRRAALALPDTIESSHMGTVDFRVGGKIFATLGYPDASFGMVQLTPDQQALLVETTPKVFVPVAGGWGRRGSTNVRLSAADPATLKNALRIAWENVALKTSAKRKAASVKKSAAPKRSLGDTDRAFARAVKAAKATKLAGIEEGTSYGTPSLTVRGKFLMRVKDGDTLVFRCTMEEKAFLMEAEPSIYFETDHYVGWPAVLVRLSVVSDAELAHCIERAWRLQAPKKLKAERANASPAKQRAAKKK